MRCARVIIPWAEPVVSLGTMNGRSTTREGSATSSVSKCRSSIILAAVQERFWNLVRRRLLAKALADCRSGQLIGKDGFGALILVEAIGDKGIIAAAVGGGGKGQSMVILAAEPHEGLAGLTAAAGV